MRIRLLVLLALVGPLVSCDNGPELMAASDGSVYLLDEGALYRIEGTTRTPVLVDESPRATGSGVWSRTDTISSLAIALFLRVKAFGSEDVRYILHAFTIDSSAVFSGPRACWDRWTASAPYLEVGLMDMDGFRVGSVSLGQFSDRSANYNPDGEPLGFTARGSVAITQADVRLLTSTNPTWRPC